ncbi:MAG: cytochrome B [Bacteroidota bacterium]
MKILIHAHSGLRWLVLIALLLAIFNAVKKMSGSTPFSARDKKIGLFVLIFTHIQFLVGLILYFMSPKVVFSGEAMQYSMLRFFLVEHFTLMTLAIILITVGYSKSKRASMDKRKFKLTFWYYLVGLVLILAGIPWPFQNYGSGWF